MLQLYLALPVIQRLNPICCLQGELTLFTSAFSCPRAILELLHRKPPGFFVLFDDESGCRQSDSMLLSRFGDAQRLLKNILDQHFPFLLKRAATLSDILEYGRLEPESRFRNLIPTNYYK